MPVGIDLPVGLRLANEQPLALLPHHVLRT